MGYCLEWCVRRVSGGYLKYLTYIAAPVGIYIWIYKLGIRALHIVGSCASGGSSYWALNWAAK